jgi:hypothetical protein
MSTGTPKIDILTNRKGVRDVVSKEWYIYVLFTILLCNSL